MKADLGKFRSLYNQVKSHLWGEMRPGGNDIVKTAIRETRKHCGYGGVARIAASLALECDCDTATLFCELVEEVEAEDAG